MSTQHTKQEYMTLQNAFDHFNGKLFGGKLPQTLITFQVRAKSRGYFAPLRFVERGGKKRVHEIALNPEAFNGRTDKQIFSTLVHEMVHLSQEQAGTAPRAAYHNKAWANEMESVGLMPSDTGEPGGKRTGQRVTHYIIDGGPFDQACDALQKRGFKLTWQCGGGAADKKAKKAKAASKTKFTCEECEQNAWAKPDANLICGECKCAMVEA